MGASRSVKRHQELFIRGINLLFSICFVAGLGCAFEFTSCLASPRGSRVLLSQLFTRLAAVVPSNWQPGKLAAPPLAVTSGSLEIYGRGRWAQVDSSETLRQAQLLCLLKLCLDKKEGSCASSVHFETAQKCERNL